MCIEEHVSANVTRSCVAIGLKDIPSCLNTLMEKKIEILARYLSRGFIRSISCSRSKQKNINLLDTSNRGHLREVISYTGE